MSANRTSLTVPFPVSLNLEGRRCIVIGDDTEAEQKSDALRASGANVERIHNPALMQDEQLRGAFFVVSTPQDEKISAHLRELADRERFLLCCIDQPAHGFVSMAAIAKAGPVRVAISTAGMAPRVGKLLRNGIQNALDETFARFIACQAAIKGRNRKRFPLSSAKRREAMIAAAHGFRADIVLRYPEWFTDEERARLPQIIE